MLRGATETSASTTLVTQKFASSGNASFLQLGSARFYFLSEHRLS